MVEELFKASVIGACLVLLLCAGASAYSGPFEFGSKVKSGGTDISRMEFTSTRTRATPEWSARAISG